MEQTGLGTETREMRDRMRDLSEAARNTAQRVVTGTKEWARENPTATLGIVAGVAAGVGLLIGLMIGRSGRNA